MASQNFHTFWWWQTLWTFCWWQTLWIFCWWQNLGSYIGNRICGNDIVNGRGGWTLCIINGKSCGAANKNGGATIDGRFLGTFVDAKSWEFRGTFDDGAWGATNDVKPSFTRPTKVSGKLSGKFSIHKLWGGSPIMIEHNLLDKYWFQFLTNFSMYKPNGIW